MKRNAKNDKEFQWLVCRRDGYICKACDKNFNYECYFNEQGVNQYVCAHHIKTKKSHPELRLDTENGITVCKKCHNDIHSGRIII